MGKIQRGLRLTKVSWRVVMREPALLLVVLIGLVGSLALSGGLFWLAFHRLPSGRDFRFPNYLVALPLFGIGSIVSTYCNVVVAVVADKRLRGENPTVSDGLAVATSKLGRILSWTLVSIAVGLVIQTIAERLKLGGWIASRLVGLTWALATTFVVPVLALEDMAVGDSIRRSAGVFKAKWGESVSAQGAISVIAFIALLPAMAIAGVGLAVNVVFGVILAVALIVGILLLSGALGSVVRVALYRYAVDGTVAGEFSGDDLAASYQPKRRGLR